MSTGSTFSLALANHILQNAALANIGDLAGLQPAATVGSLYIALHTADPGVGGNQTTNEVAYTGYARVAVVRSSAGWTTASGATTATFANAAAVAFGADTAGTPVITNFSIGTAATGTGEVMLTGALSSPLTMAVGITPSFAAGALSGTMG